MRRCMLAAILVACLLGASALSSAAGFNPLVSTAWLAANMSSPGLVVVDIREAADYSAGHIPGAVNPPYSGMAVRRELLMN